MPWTNGSALMSALLSSTVIAQLDGSTPSSWRMRTIAHTTIRYAISIGSNSMNCTNHSRSVLTTTEWSCFPSCVTSMARYFGNWFRATPCWTRTCPVLCWRRWVRSYTIAVAEKKKCSFLWITPNHTQRRGRKRSWKNSNLNLHPIRPSTDLPR